jgi:threonyl-tRNA synthetase
MLEHHSGKLPLWLAPTQLVILPVSEQFNDYAIKVMNELKFKGVRAEIDNDNQTLNYRLRKHILAKVLLIVIIGKNEEFNQTVTVRKLGEEKQIVFTVPELILSLEKEIK